MTVSYRVAAFLVEPGRVFMIISLTADSDRQANGVLARVFFREDGCFERHDGIFQKIYWRMRCSCNMQAIVNTGFMKMHKTA